MDRDTTTTAKIIGCAIEVHKRLGPGLLEHVYQVALAEELRKNGIQVFVAQMLTYLRLTGLHVGLILNFNRPLMKDGIKRVVL